MNILKINSSASQVNSISRNQVEYIVSSVLKKYEYAKVVDRDAAYNNLPYLDNEFVQAMFYRGELQDQQIEKLALSDTLIDELHASDVLVFGVPMYNFTIPASLKSYFDLIARPGKTFNFTNKGEMLGLLKNKTAIVVISSGGTPIGSPMDFTKDYITTFLKFIGITTVHFVELDQTGFKYQEKIQQATHKINAIVTAL